jgi:hypothetical protein
MSEGTEANHFVTLIGPLVDFLIKRVHFQCRTSYRARDTYVKYGYTETVPCQLRGLPALEIYKAVMLLVPHVVFASSKSFHQSDQVPSSVHKS